MSALSTDLVKVLQRSELGWLLAILRDRGYTVVGPTIRDAAIVLDEIASVEDLPIGMTAEEGPGGYRLLPRSDDAVFGFGVGPSTAKRWLLPTSRILWRTRLIDGTLTVLPEVAEAKPVALFGIRACDLQAVDILDRVCAGGCYADSHYVAVRERLFTVAVDCADPPSTCFCTSMGGSPAAESGFDIRLTEIAGPPHRFLVDPGSEAGSAIVDALQAALASEEDLAARASQAGQASQRITKRLDCRGLREILERNAENRTWDEAATRCFACGSCTMVCPTCFCSTTKMSSSMLTGESECERQWDSCFSEQFSFIHGGSVRESTMSRYRQWVTHKLAAWHEQFGVSGCVGCGRCIAWCPAGIDITEVASTIRRSDVAAKRPTVGKEH
ncbi:MAG: 4Fe-4S dicluster domain-containing protein [Fimbriimonas sp.]|nr:4Fe-4S dicluster domain-containing protein [Fimbriimonas sp.]